jgi:hypothetical protein
VKIVKTYWQSIKKGKTGNFTFLYLNNKQEWVPHLHKIQRFVPPSKTGKIQGWQLKSRWTLENKCAWLQLQLLFWGSGSFLEQINNIYELCMQIMNEQLFSFLYQLGTKYKGSEIKPKLSLTVGRATSLRSIAWDCPIHPLSVIIVCWSYTSSQWTYCIQYNIGISKKCSCHRWEINLMNIQQLSFLMRCLGYSGLECSGSPPKIKLLHLVLLPWKKQGLGNFRNNIFHSILLFSLTYFLDIHEAAKFM